MNCPHCSTPLPDGAISCYRCGTPLAPPPPPGYPPHYSMPYPAAPAPVVDLRPLTYKQYALYLFLGALPIAGLVLLLIWAFGDTPNIHQKNFAKGYLFLAVIAFAAYLAILILIALVSALFYAY